MADSSSLPLPPNLIPNYTLSRELGRGSFAVVYLARSNSLHPSHPHFTTAVKVVSKEKLNKRLTENLESEIAIMKKMKHDHIVQLLSIEKLDRYICLVMEYCRWGDLSLYIKRRGLIDPLFAGTNIDMARITKMATAALTNGNGGSNATTTGTTNANANANDNNSSTGGSSISSTALNLKIQELLIVQLGLSENPLAGPLGGLSEHVMRYFLRQLASAIAFLRNNNLIHRDLKPQNILLHPPSTWTSLANVLAPSSSASSGSSTILATSPSSSLSLHLPSLTSTSPSIPVNILAQQHPKTLSTSPQNMYNFGTTPPSASSHSRSRSFVYTGSSSAHHSTLATVSSSTSIASASSSPQSHHEQAVIHHLLSNLPVLKLADFGFARSLPQQSLASTLCGSPLYMAPEILRYEKYDAKADLWSLGAVAFEGVTGKVPFRAQNHVDLLRKIEKTLPKFPDESGLSTSSSSGQLSTSPSPSSTPPNTTHMPGSGPLLSDELRGLIKGLLKRNPIERMGFDEVFAHPAIKLDGSSSITNRRGSSAASASSSSNSVSGSQPNSAGNSAQNSYSNQDGAFMTAFAMGRNNAVGVGLPVHDGMDFGKKREKSGKQLGESSHADLPIVPGLEMGLEGISLGNNAVTSTAETKIGTAVPFAIPTSRRPSAMGSLPNSPPVFAAGVKQTLSPIPGAAHSSSSTSSSAPKTTGTAAIDIPFALPGYEVDVETFLQASNSTKHIPASVPVSSSLSNPISSGPEREPLPFPSSFPKTSVGNVLKPIILKPNTTEFVTPAGSHDRLASLSPGPILQQQQQQQQPATSPMASSDSSDHDYVLVDHPTDGNTSPTTRLMNKRKPAPSSSLPFSLPGSKQKQAHHTQHHDHHHHYIPPPPPPGAEPNKPFTFTLQHDPHPQQADTTHLSQSTRDSLTLLSTLALRGHALQMLLERLASSDITVDQLFVKEEERVFVFWGVLKYAVRNYRYGLEIARQAFDMDVMDGDGDVKMSSDTKQKGLVDGVDTTVEWMMQRVKECLAQENELRTNQKQVAKREMKDVKEVGLRMTQRIQFCVYRVVKEIVVGKNDKDGIQRGIQVLEGVGIHANGKGKGDDVDLRNAFFMTLDSEEDVNDLGPYFASSNSNSSSSGNSGSSNIDAEGKGKESEDVMARYLGQLYDMCL